MQPMSELATQLDRDGPPGNKGKTRAAEILTAEEVKALLAGLNHPKRSGRCELQHL